MDQILAKFALSLGFFTKVRLPEFLGSKISPDAKLKDAVVFFPIAGLLIGLVVATIWFVSAQFLPPLVAAGLAILCGIMVTGGLHEDGLADCADGLGGVVDKERALEIMRDSRIGTYGTLALITTTGLRWVSLAGLSIASGFSALIIAHTASRAAISMAMKYSDYARQSGLGDQVSGR
ncbi:MAG: adenosylcobinamide-GDP ribazoletransferase, partial [Pseudomonadota bacterium]